MDLMNIFRKKISSTKRDAVADSTFKKNIKAFSAFLKEEKSVYREKRTPSFKTPKEKESALVNYLKPKISDYIKNNFREKGIKSDMKSFFLYIAREYYTFATILLEQTKNNGFILSSETIILFVKSFYDLYEDEQCQCATTTTTQEIIEKVLKDKMDDSYILCIAGILADVKTCDCLDAILDKNNEMTDIGIQTMKIVSTFHKINTFIETASSENSGKELDEIIPFIKKTQMAILPPSITFLIDVMEFSDMKTIFTMIEQDNLVMFFNELSILKPLRRCIYDIFTKVNICIKDGIKIQNFKKYIQENNCLEGILSSLKNNYIKNEFSDLQELFKEILDLLILQNAFFDQNSTEFKNCIFQFILKISEDSIMKKINIEEFEDNFRYFFKELYNLSYVDKDDVKNKICDKSLEKIKASDLISNSGQFYKNYDMINCLLNLLELEDTNNTDEISLSDNSSNANIICSKNHLRKVIITVILDIDIPLSKYRMLVANTDLCKSFLENMHSCSEEIISYYFSLLLVLCENLGQSSERCERMSTGGIQNEMRRNISYVPSKEMSCVIRCITKCRNQETLGIILKHMKAFLELSSGFQRTLVNCGFFNELVKILHKSLLMLDANTNTMQKTKEDFVLKFKSPLERLENQQKRISFDNNKLSRTERVQKSSKTLMCKSSPLTNDFNFTFFFTPEMFLSVLDFSELLLMNNTENFLIFKSFNFLTSYFHQFCQFAKWKMIAYRIWSISMLYEPENEEIKKYIKFLMQRYSVLRDNLPHSDSLLAFKAILEEIMEINETIAIKFMKENTLNFLTLFQTQGQLREILLDFPNLLDVMRSFYTTSSDFDVEMYIQELCIPEDASAKQANESDKQDIIETNANLIEDGIKFFKLKKGKSQYAAPKLKLWDEFMQALAKKYFNVIFDLVQHYNRTLFTHKFKNIKHNKRKVTIDNIEPLIKKESVRNILQKIILFIYHNEGNCRKNNKCNYTYTTDMIKFLIDKSLRFKLNDESSIKKKKGSEFLLQAFRDNEKLFTENFVEHYQEKLKIEKAYLNSSYCSISNYTNLILQSPMIIRFILKSLMMVNNTIMVHDFIELIEFLCKTNENNCKLLLRQKMVKDVLGVLRFSLQSLESSSSDSDTCDCQKKEAEKICDKIMDIFEIISKFFSKSDLQVLFDYILTLMTQSDQVNPQTYPSKVILNRLICILYKNYKSCRKINKSIILSCVNTRQANIYNMIYAGGIKFSNQSLISLGGNPKDYKAKPSYLSIFLTMKFHRYIDNTNFILFKLERESKEKEISVIEISIEKLNLVIKENDQEIQNCNELKNQIRMDKNSHFEIFLSKESNEIQVKVNRRLLCLAKPDLKYLDLSGNASYSLLIGFPGTSTRDVYQDTFQSIPHISVSYLMIYADKVTVEFLDQFKLSQISSSKNGTLKADMIKLRYLSERTYKTFAPSNIINKSELFDLRMHIDPSKVVYEMVCDKLELLTNNRLEEIKAEQGFNKAQRRYFMDMMDKDYIAYIPNTTSDSGTLSSTGNGYSYNHTFLLSKFNFSEAMSLNQIFEIKSLKKTILTDVLAPTTVLDYEIRSFRILDYIFFILNEIHSLDTTSEMKSHTILHLLQLLGFYLISNLPDLAHFSHTHYFHSLLLLLYKNAPYLSNEVVDFFFSLSFGVEDAKGTRFFNPWYLAYIENVILDHFLFQLITPNLKMYIINSLNLFLSQKDMIVINEADYSPKVAILSKMYKILLTVESDEIIDEEIFKVITLILEQLFKYKKGGSEPTQVQLKKVIHDTLEFLKISENFNEPVTEHLIKRNFDQNGLNATTFLVKKLFAKLYTSSIKMIRQNLISFFIKFSEESKVQADSTRKGSGGGLQSHRIEHLIEPILKEIFLQRDTEAGNEVVITNLESETSQRSASKTRRNSDIIPEEKHIVHSTNSQKQISIRSEKKKSTAKEKKSSIINILAKSTTITSEKFTYNFSSAQQSNEYVIVNSPLGMQQPAAKTYPTKAAVKIGEEYMAGKIRTFEADLDEKNICMGAKCFFCNFLISFMKSSFKIHKSFISYKKFIKKFYYMLFVTNPKMDDYLMKSKDINFSWYMLNREGPSRIKKKLIPKIDHIKDEELVKKYYDDRYHPGENKYLKRSSLEKSLDILDLKKIFSEVLYADQIFQLNFVRYLVEEGDQFELAVNCILFKGMNHFNCVLVLGHKMFYILKNLHIDKDDNLVYGKVKFAKYFWTLGNYDEEWEKTCCYLNNFCPPDQNDLGASLQSELVNQDKTKISESIWKSFAKIKNSKDKIMYKFNRNKKDFGYSSYEYLEINELHKRRFLHQNNGIEVFMKNGKNFLFAFNVDKREMMYGKILHNLQMSLVKRGGVLTFSNSQLQSNQCIYLNKSKIFIKKHKGKLTKSDRALLDSKTIVEESQDKWAHGIISNYDYLMILNTLSGRTYSDMSQYPVFPWILKDYSTDGINLDDDGIYRNLSYPIYAQEKSTQESLKLKFEGAEMEGKYHSGTHYSNPGFTSYYLIRLKPFSYIAAEIQGGYFDTADRIFFNIKSLWDVSDKYQELTPEVYYLPELFINFNEFNFGTSQSHITVKDVMLPDWARNDPRLYVKMTKKALESCKVSEKINDWIDLIFGYKQQGIEAANSFNVFRDVCYPFDPNLWITERIKDLENGSGQHNVPKSPSLREFEKIYDDLETKMNEICDMGQNPLQIFNRPHIKKECHQKTVAFFGRWAYLMNFKLKEKEYKIKLDTKPCQIKGYYEVSDITLSKGEGGLSSFRIISDNLDERNHKHPDALNTFFIVGSKKILLGPKFMNIIDFSLKKYSFYLVKPLCKLYMEFFTYRDSPISIIRATDDGKYVIIGYEDGMIWRYRLKRMKNERLMHPEYEKKKEKGLLSRIFTRESSSQVVITKSNTKSSAGSSEKQSIGSSLMSPGSHVIQSLDAVTSPLSRTILESNPIIQAKVTFFTEEWKDYFIHSTCNSKPSKDLSKGTSSFTLHVMNHKKVSHHSIKLLEIGESYSLLIAVDTMNIIYIIDMSKFKLLRKIDYPLITKSHSQLKSICICSNTGDFIISTSYSVLLFNVNAVFIGYLNLHDPVYSKMGKITAIAIKYLKHTESDIHLFTGHDDGSLIVWKLENKLGNEEIIGNINNNLNQNLNTGMIIQSPDASFVDSYRFAYNRKYYHESLKKKLDPRMKFDILIKIECQENPLRLIKLTEDLSNLIVINDDMSLYYLGYEEYLEKKKKAKQEKICSLCLGQVGSSKILCHLCHKKLCTFCKIEQKIPEYSFKSVKPICEDCTKMINSTNKMLYDF